VAHDLHVGASADYRLLDSGGGRKLEAIGGRLLIRPCPQAIWRPRSDAAWADAVSICERRDDGGGRWRHPGGRPGDLSFRWQGTQGAPLQLALRLSAFGHVGVFVEQQPVWSLVQDCVRGIAASGIEPRVLNLFGYTGGATLAGAAAGAACWHVDSARGVLDWGRENQRRSGLQDAEINWVHDDVRSALRLSRKRGWRYHVVLADPPSWGHGAGKQVWRLDEDIAGLVDDCLAVFDEHPGSLFVLSAHTPGVQREALRNLLPAVGERRCGELGVIHADDERVLPAGVYASLQR